MKKQQFTKKLNFNKETVSKLNNSQMHEVNGGTAQIQIPMSQLLGCRSMPIQCGSVNVE